MARIALAHTDLDAKGGGEAVSLHALEALQAEGHEVHLLTLNEPDVRELNRYFDSEAEPPPIHTPDGLLAWAGREACARQRYNLKNALLNRFVAPRAGDFDLVVGTDNELSVEGPSLQYIHTPRFARLVVSKRVGQDAFRDHVYDRLCYRLGGYEARQLRDGRVLTNSEWMADVVQDAYGLRPHVVHPPVASRDLREARVPWEERENGFVAVGRLAPYKRIETVIEIVDRVRDLGHDVHLHVAGPAHDEGYAEWIGELAAVRPHVELEGEVSREAVVDLVTGHRFGLHGKRHEHFGIVVAEFVAGGALPFVPDNGGQREIVDGRGELTYNTVEEAVDRIDRVLAEPKRQREIVRQLGAVEKRYGVEGFRQRFLDHVRELL